MKAIINAELVMRDHLIPEAVLFIEDGKIAGFGEMRTTEIPEDCEIIDAKGAYVGPGFVDIHSHAGGGIRFEHDPLPAAKAHLACGTTSVLATTNYLSTVPEYLVNIKRIREVMAEPDGANIAGIYMEGPYINPNFGSESHLNPWTGGVLPEDYEPIFAVGADIIRVWTLGPEREGIEDFVKAAKKAEKTTQQTPRRNQIRPEVKRSFAAMPKQQKAVPNVERNCSADDKHRFENNVSRHKTKKASAIPNMQSANMHNQPKMSGNRKAARQLYIGDPIPQGTRLIKCGYCAAENIVPYAARNEYKCYFCHYDI